MKKLIVASVMALGFFTASAQQKIGYVNAEELMGSMPESEKVSKDLEEYQQLLEQQRADLNKEYDEQASLFVKDSAKLSAVQKDFRRSTLFKLYQDSQEFGQKAQEQLQQRQQQLFTPIRAKAMDAIKAVAKEAGYAYILDVNSLIVKPPGDDVTALVKKRLAIKDPAAATAKPAVKAN